MEKLKTAYGRLLAKTRAEMAKPRQRIEALRNQAFMLYQLLSAWEKYIGMAKMTSAQAIGLRDIEGSHEAFAKLTGEEFENVNEGSEQGQVNSMENMQKQFEDEIKGEQEGDMNMEDYAKKLKDLMDGKGKKNEKDDLEETPVDPFFSMLSNAQVAQEEADRKFAEMVEKHGNTKNLQYGDGKIKEDRVIEAEEFLKDRVLESLIPAVLADDLIDFSKPKFEEMSVSFSQTAIHYHHLTQWKHCPSRIRCPSMDSFDAPLA